MSTASEHSARPSLTALTDAELARRIGAGGGGPAAADEEAELCRRYSRRLAAFGRRRLGSGDAGRDLAQDSLLLTLEKLRSGEVREPEKIGAFILGVARTLAVAGARRAHRRRHQSIDDAGRELPAANPEPPDPIARARVTTCLESLPERQRAVVLATFYAEQSSSEIAASLGLSHANVRVIRHRSVARLRDCLALGAEESTP